jgi:AraC-like DNA-binding protein
MTTDRTPPLQPVASVRRYAGEYAAHRHGHAQVLVGLEGRLELELEGRGAIVDASCALVVPAGLAHAYLAERAARVLVIDAPPEAGLERVQHLAAPPAWRELGLPLDAASVVGALAGAARRLPRRRLDLDRIDAALAGHLHEPWPTARLAVLCHLSVPRFHARFVELTGQTPAAYVRQRRLDEAERLLRAGLPLETTALQTGYATASALAFALRRERAQGARSLRRPG